MQTMAYRQRLLSAFHKRPGRTHSLRVRTTTQGTGDPSRAGSYHVFQAFRCYSRRNREKTDQQLRVEHTPSRKNRDNPEQADGWFIGYNPRIVVGVRVGANNSRVHFNSTALGQGANMALPIFGLFMQECLQSNTYKPIGPVCPSRSHPRIHKKNWKSPRSRII